MKKAKILTMLFAFLVSLLTFPTVASADGSMKSSDAIIKTKIVTTYTLNPHLNPFKIDVAVKNGQVVLSGAVSNDTEKDLAYEIARGVDGVTSVTNHLTSERNVRKGTTPAFAQKVTDAGTTAAVKSKLLMDKNTSGLNIHVSTINGVVTLEGNVSSDAEKQLAEQITSNTNDVIKVNNNLQVVAG